MPMTTGNREIATRPSPMPTQTAKPLGLDDLQAAVQLGLIDHETLVKALREKKKDDIVRNHRHAISNHVNIRKVEAALDCPGHRCCSRKSTGHKTKTDNKNGPRCAEPRRYRSRPTSPVSLSVKRLIDQVKPSANVL